MKMKKVLDLIEEGSMPENQRNPESPRYMAGQMLGHIAKAQEIAAKLSIAVKIDTSGMSGLAEMGDVAKIVQKSLLSSGLNTSLRKVERIFAKDKSLSKAERLQFRQGKVDAFRGHK